LTPLRRKASPLIEVPRNLSVFINCPFDQEYECLFRGVVFATLACGFWPRSALETGTASVGRLERIKHALVHSKYSIHDLSRCRGEALGNFARFNMPLELGIAMGLNFAEPLNLNKHDWLPLVPEGHAYVGYISDLAGFDPLKHDQTIESLVSAVMSWLATRADAPETPAPSAVLDRLPAFEKRCESLSKQWNGRLPWTHLLGAANEFAAHIP